jgi:hypothetical protein
MAVKAREKEDAHPSVAQLETRRRRNDGNRIIVERPRWSEDLARPPYEPRESRVAEVERH